MSDESKHPFSSLYAAGKDAVLTLAAIYAEAIFAKREQWNPKWMEWHTAQQLAAPWIYTRYLSENDRQESPELRDWLEKDTYGGLKDESEVRDLLWQIDIDGCLENRLYCDSCGDQFGEDGEGDVEALYPWRGELICENCWSQHLGGEKLPEPKYGKRTPGPKGVFVLPKSEADEIREGLEDIKAGRYHMITSATDLLRDKKLETFIADGVKDELWWADKNYADLLGKMTSSERREAHLGKWTPPEQSSAFEPKKQIDPRTGTTVVAPPGFFGPRGGDQISAAFLDLTKPAQWWYSAYWGEPFRDDERVPAEGSNPIFGPYSTQAQVFRAQRDVVLAMYNDMVERRQREHFTMPDEGSGKYE